MDAVETDVGIAKTTNQDSACITVAQTPYGQIAMAMICDGMGGLEKGELASAVSMLAQLHQMRLPRRSSEEKQLIEKAKLLLIERQAMTEPEAHHALQKGAMDKGMKLTDYASLLLKTL